MFGCMVAANRAASVASGAAEPRIDFAIFEAKCAEHGATTDVARAQVVGVNRTTIWRWRKGLCAPDLTVATEIAEQFGITLDELTGRAA